MIFGKTYFLQTFILLLKVRGLLVPNFEFWALGLLAFVLCGLWFVVFVTTDKAILGVGSHQSRPGRKRTLCEL